MKFQDQLIKLIKFDGIIIQFTTIAKAITLLYDSCYGFTHNLNQTKPKMATFTPLITVAVGTYPLVGYPGPALPANNASGH